jgi:hypothetical protein
MQQEPARRLNSWKQIAAYLGRDRRTVMRWEKRAGMPVHRIPGSNTGRSVYAFGHELDDWLSNGENGQTGSTPGGSGWSPRARATAKLASGVVLLGALTPILLRVAGGGQTSSVITTVEARGSAVVAQDQHGQPLWSYSDPEGSVFTGFQAFGMADFDGDSQDGIVIAANAEGGPGQHLLRGELLGLSAHGALRWRRLLVDTLHFGAASFGGPWVSNQMAVRRIDDRLRIVWASHDYRWWPSIVEIVDGQGKVTGKFVNSGWILSSEVVESPEGDRVLLGGISNSRAGAMLAVLAGDFVHGSSPEDTNGGFACLDCGEEDALAYFVFPPSHVNRASGLPYNRTAGIEVTDDGVRVIVIEGAEGSNVQWIYDFSPELELVRVTPGDSYWPTHRLLRLEGRIDHSEEECSERSGTTVRRWTRAEGWVDVAVASGLPPNA